MTNPKQADTQASALSGEQLTYKHGPNCPHCAVRRAISEVIASDPPPRWNLVVTSLLVVLADLIAAEPDPDARLRAMVYARRELPQLVASFEQDYNINHATNYTLAPTKGSA